MRGILINSTNCTVTEVELKGDDYREIYGVIGCETFDVIGFPGHSLFIDDEGLLKSPEKFFCIPGVYPEWLAGNGLILGVDDEGESIACNIPLDVVRQACLFGELAQVADIND